MFEEKLSDFIRCVSFEEPLLVLQNFDLKVLKRNFPLMPSITNYFNFSVEEKIAKFLKTLNNKNEIFLCKVENISAQGIESLVCFHIGPSSFMDITHLKLKAICPINILDVNELKKLSEQYDKESFLKLKLDDTISTPGKTFLIMSPHEYLETLSVLDVNFYFNLFDTNFEKIGDSSTEDLENPLKILQNHTSFNNANCFNNVLKFTSLGFKNYAMASYNIAYTFDKEFKKHTLPKYENFAAVFSKRQAEHWANQVVKRGIEFYQESKYMEANQCLNKALVIDPTNVNALVAKGALYVAISKLVKAVEFFEEAIELEPTHKNAKRYLHQTYLALGKSLEADYWAEAIVDINERSNIETFDPKSMDDGFKRYDLETVIKENEEEFLFVRYYKRALKYADIPERYLPPGYETDPNYDLTTVIDEVESEIEGTVEWLIKSLVFYSTLEETDNIKKTKSTILENEESGDEEFDGHLKKRKKRKRSTHHDENGNSRSPSNASSASTFSDFKASIYSSSPSPSSSSSDDNSKSLRTYSASTSYSGSAQSQPSQEDGGDNYSSDEEIPKKYADFERRDNNISVKNVNNKVNSHGGPVVTSLNNEENHLKVKFDHLL